MLLRATLLGLLASSLSMATTVFVTTGQAGAQTQIDSAHSSSWVLNVTSTGYELGGGRFEMKDGSGTTVDLALTLYSNYVDINNIGTQVAQVIQTHTEFCDAVGGAQQCGSFNTHVFSFTTAYTLAIGTYYLELTSISANDPQKEAYFIKSNNGSFTGTDVNGTALVPSPFGSAPVITPEPSTMLLSGLGLVALGLMKRNKRS